MIAGLIRILAGARANWLGVAPFGKGGSVVQRVYFANHTSNMDAPVIWASLPGALREITRPLAARDYWMGGPLRRYLAKRVFNAVLIERHNIRKSNNPLTVMRQALDEGSSLILFPEGGRVSAPDAALGEFKPGLWHLARQYPQVELVPVFVENLNRVLPKGELLLVPVMSAVNFGAPISLQPDEGKAEFMTRARDAICGMRERRGANAG